MLSLDHSHPRRSDDHPRSSGFSLVELLIVIVVLGILTTVTVFAVRGITDRGEEASCATDARTLATAAEIYFANEAVDVIPASGAGVNRFEQRLVDDGYLQSTSAYYDLAADGTVTTSGTPCT